MNTIAPITSLLAVSILALATACPVTAAGDPVPSHAAGEPSPVYIDTAKIGYLESWPVQVRLAVTGSVPTPCHKVASEVQDLGTSLDVRLWSLADPRAICASVLEPFDVSIDLGSYESADLPVFLNGESVGRIVVGDTRSGPSLSGAGWSFGRCLGYCAADLTLEGDELAVTGRASEGGLALYENRARLTPEGRRQLDAALAALEGTELQPVYGCPDCADGGSAYIEIVRDGEVERSVMEFGAPPEDLAELHAISLSLIGAVEGCEPGPLVELADDCVPFEG